jgi:hypothetical protein
MFKSSYTIVVLHERLGKVFIHVSQPSLFLVLGYEISELNKKNEEEESLYDEEVEVEENSANENAPDSIESDSVEDTYLNRQSKEGESLSNRTRTRNDKKIRKIAQISESDSVEETDLKLKSGKREKVQHVY